ncbi:alanine racemase [Olleya sp. YSTF-M6]|uniref:Alanine racemase n=1 Tax=Olleya sediminilitoris TaxID=2795739 RepID=A0ABS1WGX9_9FLAO|nr:alanine racemase [Olleya sediminilitoris]MBL7558373.1 alanine racemase [Olleya sediminilitoris]
MDNVQETILEIDLKALKHNFKHLKSRLHNNTKFLAVVKAFAYGSDAAEVAKYLEQLNIDYFAVAYTYEGVALRDAGITTPILVLHPQPVSFDDIIKRCLEPSIYSQRVLDLFIASAEIHKQHNYPVHLKFNTGLNRLGFGQKDIPKIAEALSKTEAIKVTSLFSHLAESEVLDDTDFTKSQIESFTKIYKDVYATLSYKPFLHICNTSGIINYPEAHFDMVRSGIGLNGYGNDPEVNKHLKPIAALKTNISQIHHIKKGKSLGYNRAFIAQEDTRTATLPLGHADGIKRQYGNKKGFVTINNQKAFILGNVCMDMIMVDVTNIKCKEGDQAIIFDDKHTAEDLAGQVNSISYELLTAVSQRVKRVIRR